MAVPETTGFTTARSEHSNADDVYENSLKNSFMKMIEALNEEREILLKKWRKR